MILKRAFVFLAVALAMVSCNVSQDLTKAYNMVNCKYSYHSLTALTISGTDLSSGFSLAQLPMITSLLSGKNSSIPITFNLNMNVNNPHATEAVLNGLQYIVSIDDIEFTAGSISNRLQVGAGATQVLPLKISVDLATLMESNSKDAVLNIARNIAGIGSGQSKVALQVKPTFMLGNTLVPSPLYIPVNFNIGGKK